MPMFRKYLLFLKYILLISIFTSTYHLYSKYPFTMICLLIFSSILMINDYVRSSKLSPTFKHGYYISLLFTILGSALLKYFVDGSGTVLYVLLPLIELLGLKGRKLVALFLTHSLLLLAVSILQIFALNTLAKPMYIGPIIFLSSLQASVPYTWDKIAYLGRIASFYLAIASIAYSVKLVEMEKEEVKQLNEKLQFANIKLQEYTMEVEELATSRERTRMAQELHDSLGHSLMALSMHLEFAKKIFDKKPEKVKEVLIKSEDIAKSSITSLRQAVNLLKEERELKSFNSSIEELINNFHLLTNMKFNFKTDASIDDLPSISKNSMYRAIQESITNSLKHGKAKQINISISRKYHCVHLVLSDNGIGCENIIKSNGLKGIEDRIEILNGSVKYFITDNLGFGIDIEIPTTLEEV